MLLCRLLLPGRGRRDGSILCRVSCVVGSMIGEKEFGTGRCDVRRDGRKETIVFLLLLIIFSYWTGRETGGFHFCGKEMIVPSSSSPIPSDEKELDRNIFYWRRHRNTTPGPAQQRINAIGNRMTTTGDDDDDGFNSIRRTVSSRPSSSSFLP